MNDDVGSEPQFDHMEPRGESAASACTACQRTIPDVYFEAGGKVFCAACKDAALVSLTGGSGLFRLVKAGVLGTIAAAVSAAGWYGIVKLTGYELGIVAIVVGLLVGGAVRLGAEQRGGWLYQTLAVLLTYLAIATSYVPLALESLEQEAAQAAAQQQAVGAEDAEAGAEDAASVPSDAPLLAIAIVGSFVYPVYQVVDGGVIGLLIVCFALYEAWKINKRHTLAFSGPFQLQRSAGA